MAKGKERSLAARGLALLFALALIAVAAKLWLGSTPEAEFPPDDTTGSSFVETEPRAEDAVSAPLSQHGEIGAEDREALREILRDSQAEPE